MKTTWIVASIIALAIFTGGRAAAQDLARAELETAQGASLSFVSYEGPHSRIDSLADIKGIGAGLGAAIVTLGQGASGSVGSADRYQVIRVLDPATKEGLEADILVIGKAAQVDHIRNLRWIIAGYLSAAWKYSEKDAYLLATFATVYNAVHRGDSAYVEANYKKAVGAKLSAASIGLSTKYHEWPGQTSILIPLGTGAKQGKLGAVDTSAVASPAVTESLRGEPDKGIPDRQAMVDFKDREAAEKEAEAARLKAEAARLKAEAEKAQAALAAERARLEAERAKLEAAKAAEAAKVAQKPAEPTRPSQGTEGGETKPPAETTETTATTETSVAEQETEKSPEVATAEEAVAQAEEAVAQAEEAVTAAETETAAATEAAETASAEAEAKKDEAEIEREAITEDQKEVIAEEVAAKSKAEERAILLYKIVDEKLPFVQLVLVDPETGAELRSSLINSLHGRSIVDAGDHLLAAAGKEGGDSAVRLVRVDKTSLEATEGGTDLFVDSLVWRVGGRVYAVVKGSGGDFHLARFGEDLAEAARSAEAVHAYTLLAEGAGGLVVQSPTGGFIVLAPEGLEKSRDLQP